jgi:hypothetical protein
MAYKKTIAWKKAAQGFSYALGDAGKHLSGWARELMGESTSAAISRIDSEWEGETHWKRKSGKVSSFGGDMDHPWYTGQLHDSVAGIVSDKHRTVAIEYMPQAATKPQEYKGSIVIGHDWAMREARNIERALHFVPGIKSTLIVGVPYADKVNEMPRHQGFVQSLSAQFANYVEEFFVNRAGNYWYERTYVADAKKR